MLLLRIHKNEADKKPVANVKENNDEQSEKSASDIVKPPPFVHVEGKYETLPRRSGGETRGWRRHTEG